MNDTMWKLIIINAMAVMNVHGTITAVRYMVDNGMTIHEAMNVINAYDRALNRVILGQIP